MKPSDYQPFDADVHEYVDGRMTADAERDFERRLERNPELKQQVDGLRKALQALRELPVRQPAEGFDERVMARIRELELADRARQQIVSAPVPLWQHVVQVGLGAAAAALVFAIVGMPGLFDGSDALDLPQNGGGDVARVSATEQDLLPALADQHARFESMRRSIACTRVSDPFEQRELLSMELQNSELSRRNAWLRVQVAELPANQRAPYDRFLATLDDALNTLGDEITASQQEGRPVNMSVVDGALARVQSPRGPIEHVRISNNSGQLVPEGERVGARNLDDVALYSLVRRAEYRHDHESVIDAVEVYLAHMKTGRYKQHAIASAIAAHLRLGQDREAAARFTGLGEYDEDIAPGQLDTLRGMLTQAEFTRLNAARKALRGE
jgi:hypothetical protein